jgi:hypothetical protein
MQKNIRIIPKRVLDRIHAFELDDIVVACVKRIEPLDVDRYAHLGLKLTAGQLVLPDSKIPPLTAGRFSRANVEGREVIRKDLPMTMKSYSWESPNWGDWSNGSHTHTITRDVYQRDFIPPKELELSTSLLETSADGKFVVKFAIEQTLSRRAADFETDLLYNLNLLQENVGAVDVFPSAASLADYTNTVQIDWEILPPGNVDEVLKRMLQGKRPVEADRQRVMEQRLPVLSRFKPEAYIAGTNGFLRYFGAKYSDNLVVFENLNYGNAVYVMYEKWEALSKRSRVDLLKGDQNGFDRIEHREGWADKLGALLKRKKSGVDA